MKTKTCCKLWLLIVVPCFLYGTYVGQERRHAEDLGLLEAKVVLAEARYDKMNDMFVQAFGKDFDVDHLQSTVVQATSYNPTIAQCDSTPMRTAFNTFTTPGIVAVWQPYRQKMGWRKGQIIVIEGLGPMQIMDHKKEGWATIDIISLVPAWSLEWGKRERRIWWVAHGLGNSVPS